MVSTIISNHFIDFFSHLGEAVNTARGYSRHGMQFAQTSSLRVISGDGSCTRSPARSLGWMLARWLLVGKKKIPSQHCRLEALDSVSKHSTPRPDHRSPLDDLVSARQDRFILDIYSSSCCLVGAA